MCDEELRRYLEREAKRRTRVPPGPTTAEEYERMAPGPGWRLAWADEFERPGPPDPDIWEHRVGTADLGNKELEYSEGPEAGNARVEDGRLVIEARREERHGRHYTSARLYSRVSHAVQHGKVEVKARLPGTRGVSSGIWLAGADLPVVGWPRCAEIDFAELIGFNPRWVYFAVHNEAYNHAKGNPKVVFTELPEPDRRFHVYTAEWDADLLRLGANGATYLEYERAGTTDPAVWPFDKPFQLVLSVSVGGNWGGMFGVDDAALPQRMEVEYVRVYRRL